MDHCVVGHGSIFAGGSFLIGHAVRAEGRPETIIDISQLHWSWLMRATEQFYNALYLTKSEASMKRNLVYSGHSIAELKALSMYWDEIVMFEGNRYRPRPHQKLLEEHLDFRLQPQILADLYFLQKEGVLTHMVEGLPSDTASDALQRIEYLETLGDRWPWRTEFMDPVSVLLSREAQNQKKQSRKSLWSLAGDGFDTPLAGEGRSALVTLFRALPIPTGDFPLEELIALKRRRHDELLALHHHLEMIYQRILAAPDIQLQGLIEVEKLQVAIRNLAACVSETRKPFDWMGVEVKLSIETTGAIVGGALGAMAASTTHLPILAGLGAALGALKLQISGGIKTHRAPSTEPFSYITSITKELRGAFDEGSSS